VTAAARHRCATSRSSVPHSTEWIMPRTMTSSSLRNRPAPFKIHSPPWGRLPSSRCIRSALYEGVQTRAFVQGAPDTALRLIRTDSAGNGCVANVLVDCGERLAIIRPGTRPGIVLVFWRRSTTAASEGATASSVLRTAGLPYLLRDCLTGGVLQPLICCVSKSTLQRMSWPRCNPRSAIFSMASSNPTSLRFLDNLRNE
jgi:hypothetical protein